jgi:hypothetical protein
MMHIKQYMLFLVTLIQQRFTSIVQDTKKNEIKITVQGVLNEHVISVFSVFVQTLEYVTCCTSATNDQAQFVITPNKLFNDFK